MGLSNATTRRDLTAIASVLGHAEDLDWIDGNPARDLLTTDQRASRPHRAASRRRYRVCRFTCTRQLRQHDPLCSIHRNAPRGNSLADRKTDSRPDPRFDPNKDKHAAIHRNGRTHKGHTGGASKAHQNQLCLLAWRWSAL